MPDNRDDERTLDLPDTNLPFFAYGIFKPGQLAYSKIRNHVDGTIDAKIDYGMRHRDGVPILIGGKSDNSHTKGVVITFKEGQEIETYGIICKTLLRKLYEWKTIRINGRDVNTVFGVNPDYGSDHIEGSEDRFSFDGKNDPFFSEAIELIESNLNSSGFSWNVENFFELQMNYMLLWSAIDRFSSLKYNKKSNNKNYEKFSSQKAFRDGIRRFENHFHREVFSTDDLKVHNFDADNPIGTMYYYYTLRCNVVHRGKAMVADYEMLNTAAKELLAIFKDVLNDAFDENGG